MNAAIKKIYDRLKREHLDGLFVSSPANISYLTGYRSRDSYFIVSPKENIYLTDSRYTAEAKKSLQNVRVEQFDGALYKTIGDICRQRTMSCLGFEERFLSFAAYTRLRKGLPDSMGLAPTVGWVEELRQIKTPAEVEKIRKALSITMAAFRFVKKFLKAGQKEVEVAGEIERFIRYHGSSGASFEIIVASGPNSSYPHHIASKRKLKQNEPVLIDFGVDYSGYKSDLTRVFFLGTIKPSVKKVYAIVRQAQRLALSAIRPGKTAGQIDRIARDHIANQGYGACFGHGLGHGIGLEVHEDPHIGKKQAVTLQAGMVVTVEPAIYLPARFGVRLEDMVLVTGKGNEVLSGTLDQ